MNHWRVAYLCAFLTLLVAGICSSPPVRAADVAGQTPPATGAGAIRGVVTGAGGGPLSGVTIRLSGPTTASTTTDAGGRYGFPGLVPGLYTISAAKPGYAGATQADFSVLPGTTQTANVTLAQATLSSLREIGRTSSSTSRSTFNTSPAAIQIVSAQAFRDQQQLQVTRILDQTPGIVVSLPGGVNGGSPGAISFPNIRGALSFETADLVDGHPLSVGQYGDYVTTFLNSFILQDVEIIKGPGAASPTISRAIGGTVNFRTLDPTAKPSGTITLGVDSAGGGFSNFGYSGTTGKLGVVADYAVYGTPGPLQNAQYYMALNSNNYTVSDSHGKVISLPETITNTQPSGQNNTRGEAATSLLFCCTTLNTTYTNKDELLKLRYSFSPSTSLTTSFLGSQTYADQNGNNGNQLGTFFAPAAGYAGSIAPGGHTIVDPDNYGSPAWEINNEPMFQAELRTALGKDNLLARYYTASINRLQYGANHDPTGSQVFGAAIFGAVAGGPVFNGLDQFGKPYQLSAASPYYDSAEEDRLHGESLEYDHFLGASNDVVSLSYDTNRAATHSYYFGDTVDSVPAGSTQTTSTFLLRGLFNIGKLNVTASDYLTNFRSHFGVYNNAFSSSQTLTFDDQDLWHEDARLGLVFRLAPDTSLRASAGSAVAPPYLGALVTYASPPQLCGTNSSTACPISGVLAAVDTESNAGLKAETSFGYDVGADVRFKDRATVVSGDLYLTNLRNQLVQGQFLNGTAVVAGHAGPLPLYTTAYTNVSNARYEGAELTLRREPAFGLGYTLSGALLRAYPYNLAPSLYAPVDGQPTSNLGVVSNINFGSHQTIDNQAIPYSQGYAELRYHTRHGELFSFGETYYGPNNSLNVRAFVVGNATARTIIARQTSLQLSVDNLFNIYGGSLPTEYTGIGQVFVDKTVYASNANVVGPRIVRLSVTHNFGGR